MHFYKTKSTIKNLIFRLKPIFRKTANIFLTVIANLKLFKVLKQQSL